MKDYMKRTVRKRGEEKKLGRALPRYSSGMWNMRQSSKLFIAPSKIFMWFLEQATEVRHSGDVDKSKALLTDVLKLLENSSYGKLIEVLEQQVCVIYTKDEKVV